MSCEHIPGPIPVLFSKVIDSAVKASGKSKVDCKFAQCIDCGVIYCSTHGDVLLGGLRWLNSKSV